MSNPASSWRTASLPFTAERDLYRQLDTLLAPCPEVLDIGCGRCSPVQFYRKGRTVGVDLSDEYLDEARRTGTHDELRKASALEIEKEFGPAAFDACIALDLIEHLPKEGGWELLRQMEAVARRRVILFTPNGFLPQRNREREEFQEHQSGWTTEDFRSRGYQVMGMHGPKSLRGEYHGLRHRPKVLWALVSWLGQNLYCRSRPETSAALLAWKDLAAAR
jgi:hypothetical protein